MFTAAPHSTSDICLISSFSVLLTPHASCCQRTPHIHPEAWQLSPSASLSPLGTSAWALQSCAFTASLEPVSLSGTQLVLCRPLWYLLFVLMGFPHRKAPFLSFLYLSLSPGHLHGKPCLLVIIVTFLPSLMLSLCSPCHSPCHHSFH